MAAVVLFSAGGTPSLSAQDRMRCTADGGNAIVRQIASRTGVPRYPLGENLRYSASFGPMHVGSGYMRLIGEDSIEGRRMWRAVLFLSGGFAFLKVRDSTESWFDPLTFTSRRFIQELREPRYSASKYFDIYPERQTYQQRGKTEMPSVADAMDDVSFV